MFDKYNGFVTYKPKSYLGYLNSKSSQEYEIAKKNFWKKYYADRNKAVFFPMYQNRKTSERIYLTKEIILQEDTINHMQLYGKRNLLTKFQIILGIWGLVIAEQTNERDLIIGTFFPGRKNKSLDMIGLFTTCLGVRLQVKDTVLSSKYFNYVKQQCELIYEYQDTSIREVFRYLPFKDLVKGELFGILINYHSNLSFSENGIGGNINISLEDLSMEPNSYPLNISIYEYANKIKMNISYDINKYETEYVSDIAASFMNRISELERNVESCCQ